MDIIEQTNIKEDRRRLWISVAVAAAGVTGINAEVCINRANRIMEEYDKIFPLQKEPDSEISYVDSK